MKLKRITIKESGIKPSLYRQIKQHALNSFYRQNATTSGIYSFDVVMGKYGETWEGGWGWLDNERTIDGSMIIKLDDGKLYKQA